MFIALDFVPLVVSPRLIHSSDSLIYIGKETNSIEDQLLQVTKPQIFINEEEIKQKTLALTPEEARKIGIKYRSGLSYLNKKARDEKLNFNTSMLKLLTM